MIRDDQRRAAVAMHAIAQARDRRVDVEQRARRALAQRDDQLRRDQLDLPIEIRAARLRPRAARACGCSAAGISARSRCRRCCRARGRAPAACCRAAARPAPTNGSPCASSSAPGASPTNIHCASASPTPGTVRCARRAQRRRRVHAAMSAASASKASDRDRARRASRIADRRQSGRASSRPSATRIDGRPPQAPHGRKPELAQDVVARRIMASAVTPQRASAQRMTSASSRIAAGSAGG